MPELTKEERLARAMKLAESEQANDTEEVFEIIDEKDSKPLTKEERLARALGQSESKKKVLLNRFRVRKNLHWLQANRRRNNLRVQARIDQVH